MADDAAPGTPDRFFTAYTGVALPFRLAGEIAPDSGAHRTPFNHASFDTARRLTGFDKLVYGAVELSHRYRYHASGALAWARIVMLDEDAVDLSFDDAGSPRS